MTLREENTEREIGSFCFWGKGQIQSRIQSHFIEGERSEVYTYITGRKKGEIASHERGEKKKV